MREFKVTMYKRGSGSSLRTVVHATSYTDAKKIAEAQYGSSYRISTVSEIR